MRGSGMWVEFRRVSTSDPAQRIQWLLWGASAVVTPIFMIVIASLDEELQSLHHERTWWVTAWFWTQMASPPIAQLLLLPTFRRGGLVLPAISVVLSVLMPGGYQVPAFVAATVLGTRSKALSLPVAIGAQITGTALGLVISPLPWPWADWWIMLPTFIYTVTAVLLGILLRSHQDLAEARVIRARSQERERISREMHDSLAQQISLISLHAAALGSRRDLDADRTAHLANTIRATAAEAGRELRQILHVLHEDGSKDGAVVTWQEVLRLVDQQRDAGLDVHLDIGQDWKRLFDEAMSPTRHAILRIVAEALANARHHGSDDSTHLSLTATDASLVVECTNPAVRPSRPRPGHGLGLPGLHERVRLLGGRLSAGRAAGRFTLRAELPLADKSVEEHVHG